MPIEAKRLLVEPERERLSIARQCELLGMSRAAYYYEPWEWDETALAMLRAIDEEYTRHPFLGKRRMCDYLEELGYDVGVKRTRMLMAWLGLEAIYPKRAQVCRIESIRSIRTCSKDCRSLARTRFGRATSLTCVWAVDSRI